MADFIKNKFQPLSSRRLPVILTALFVLTSVAWPAEQGDIAQRISRSIQQTRKQLEVERQRIAREQQAQEDELNQTKLRQEQLVDKIVDAKFSIASKEKRLKEIRLEREKLRRQKDKSDRQWSQVSIITADACQKLADSLDTLPPGENRSKQTQLLSDIESSLKNPDPAQIDIISLLQLLDSLLEESRTTAVSDQNILNARGYQERVKLLRVGQILFAYKSLSTGQTAIASAVSGDEKGFRWNQNIAPWASEQISMAIDNAPSKKGIYSLPVDVTGQLTADRSYGPTGFWQKVSAGGPVMIPLAIVAIVALALIVERFIFLSIQGRNTVKTAEAILAACHAGNFPKAEKIAVENPGVTSRTLLACLSRRLENIAVMEDAVAEAVLHELPKLERFLPSIGILAGVAPLLGLLGTVTGMIATFDAITVFGSGQPRLMAGGISEALLTTAAGLAIAIPVLLIHSFLASRSDKIIADTERFAATLLNLLREDKGTSKTNTGSGGGE